MPGLIRIRISLHPTIDSSLDSDLFLAHQTSASHPHDIAHLARNTALLPSLCSGIHSVGCRSTYDSTYSCHRPSAVRSTSALGSLPSSSCTSIFFDRGSCAISVRNPYRLEQTTIQLPIQCGINAHQIPRAAQLLDDTASYPDWSSFLPCAHLGASPIAPATCYLIARFAPAPSDPLSPISEVCARRP